MKPLIAIVFETFLPPFITQQEQITFFTRSCVAAVKSLPVHLINDVIFSIFEDRSARHYCYVYMLDGILVSCI
jgi:hypothetical protein